MSQLVYLLCAIASVICAWLLIRGYWQSRTTLLLWSSLCFVFLAGNNIFMFIDLVVYPNLDFHGSYVRNLLTAISGSLLLFGLIWEAS
jgi:hypothetical protein